MDGYLNDSQNGKHGMNQAVGRYVVSFQSEPFHRGRRYHWMICSSMSPDELVSWGYAPTQKLAEQAAQIELKDLSSWLSKGGRVTSEIRSVPH
jgi:hypothetical protein